MAFIFAAIAGALTAFSLNHQIWYLSILCIALFLRTLENKQRRRRLVVSFIFAAVYFLLHIQWISLLGFDVWLGLSLMCTLPWLLLAVPVLPNRGSAAILFPTALVVVIELIRSTVPWGGFPWGLLAYSQVDGPLVRLATLGGSSLVTGVVVALAAIVNMFLRTWNWKLLLLPAALILATGRIPHVAPTGSIKVALIQGNVPRAGYTDKSQALAVAQNHLRLTAKYLASVATGSEAKPDLVVWPESGTDIDPIPAGDIHDELTKLTNTGTIPILVGASTWNPQLSAPMNAGILWEPDIGPTQMYVKNHLVPFGEYIPLRSYLSSVIGRLDQIRNDFIPGSTPGVFHVAQHKIGDVICFEVAYGDHIRRTIAQGAEVIAVQSNNATYMGTRQPEQQFNITRFRAIEHQRAFVVASTSGISGIIDQNGKVISKTAEMTSAIVTGEVATITSRSITDRFPYWVIVACLAYLALTLFARRKHSNGHLPQYDELR